MLDKTEMAEESNWWRSSNSYETTSCYNQQHHYYYYIYNYEHYNYVEYAVQKSSARWMEKREQAHCASRRLLDCGGYQPGKTRRCSPAECWPAKCWRWHPSLEGPMIHYHTNR
jgi:hypothetical protein